jgi:hypothetical protein
MEVKQDIQSELVTKLTQEIVGQLNGTDSLSINFPMNPQTIREYLKVSNISFRDYNDIIYLLLFKLTETYLQELPMLFGNEYYHHYRYNERMQEKIGARVNLDALYNIFTSLKGDSLNEVVEGIEEIIPFITKTYSKRQYNPDVVKDETIQEEGSFLKIDTLYINLKCGIEAKKEEIAMFHGASKIKNIDNG